MFASTTFGGETLSLAAARATLTKLRAEDVPRRLGEAGTVLMRTYEHAARERGLATQTAILGYPQRPVVAWGNAVQQATFNAVMLDRGFLYQGYFNLTLAHAREPGLQDRLEAAIVAGLDAAATS